MFVRLQYAALASASSRFHPGCCCSVCSSWQVTGATGPESAVLPLCHKKQSLLSQKGRLETWPREHNSPISRKPDFLLWGRKFHAPSTSVKDQKAASSLGQGPSLLEPVMGTANMAGGTGATHLGMSQTEWRGDPQITRRFLDFLKVGFKNENFIHKQFWRKKQPQKHYESCKQDSGTKILIH